MDIEFVRRHVNLADDAVRIALLEDRPADASYGDDVDDAIIEEAEPFAIAFDMTYAGSGSIANRRVRLVKIMDVGTDIHFNAWCYVRQAYRTFNLSKVIQITDIATGDVFDDARVFFVETGILAPETAEAMAISRCFNELTVLAFLGGCDGQFIAAEKDELVKHVCLKASVTLNEDVIRRRVATFAPDEKAFLKAMRNLATDDEGRRALIRSIRNVIDADGRAHENEIVVGAKLLKALGVSI